PSGAPARRVDVLRGDVRVHGLRAGNRELDLEFSSAVPRIRSAHDRCGRGFLVLGLADRRLLDWLAAAENLRQPARAARRGRWGDCLSFGRAVWSGEGVAYRVSRDWLVLFRAVADCDVAGA